MSTYGFNQQRWDEAKSEAKQVLIERAKVRGMIPYSELVNGISAIYVEAHDQRLFNLLGEISTEEEEARRGMLTVIVVHKDGDMQPGPGFFEPAKELGRDTSDILQCWVEELHQVHGCWSK